MRKSPPGRASRFPARKDVVAGGPLPLPPPFLLKSGNGRRWRLSLGLVFQTVVVALLLLVPLLLTDQMDAVTDSRTILVVPTQRGELSGKTEVIRPGGPQSPETHAPTLTEVPVHLPYTSVPGAEVGPVSTAGIGPDRGGVPLGIPEGVGHGLVPWLGQPIGPSVPLPQPQRPVRVGGRVQPPKLLYRVEPEYPAFAQRAGIEGTVVLEALLGTDGRVQQITAKSGHPVLVRAAGNAVAQWLYQPTYLNDQPVPLLLEVRVEFRLRR